MNNRDTIEIKIKKSISSLQSSFLSLWKVRKISTWNKTFKTLEWFEHLRNFLFETVVIATVKVVDLKPFYLNFTIRVKRKNVWSSNHKLVFEFAELLNFWSFYKVYVTKSSFLSCTSVYNHIFDILINLSYSNLHVSLISA